MATPQITVGLDFGTHQTKVCVERKEGAELKYSFFKFKDTYGHKKFTLPSIIKVNADNTLSYGYVDNNDDGQIIRYFKQSTFTTSPVGLNKQDAIYYSIWYLAYILFQLEDRWGNDFAIQMGVPSDGEHLEVQRKLAVSIVLSAYRLVEEVYGNDSDEFLSSTINELRDNTELIGYTKDLKDDYSILVFPEAYACLLPLVTAAKIAPGMSLMVDIGGGTTDISFFSIIADNKNPRNSQLIVYDFKSINKGLNFMTNATAEVEDNRNDSNVHSQSELILPSVRSFKSDINNLCSNLRGRLFKEFHIQGNLPKSHLEEILKNRPIVYTGGGSIFPMLRRGYHGFQDIIHISLKYWRTSIVADIDCIESLGLCPILSTAYGLSISRKNDDIKCEPLRELFSGIRQTKKVQENHPKKPHKPFGADIGGNDGFSYSDDYDAWK